MSITYIYDAFISYRRGRPDEAFALRLLRKLEAAGYKVAIDRRDFKPNATFLSEMERCIKESRFTLAVISPRYLASGNCGEEAIICKVLDMGERKRRLLPLVIEASDRPVWLYDLVGIDFAEDEPLVPPFEKLKSTLGNPLNSPYLAMTAVGRAGREAQAPEADRLGSGLMRQRPPLGRRWTVTLAGMILACVGLGLPAYLPGCGSQSADRPCCNRETKKPIPSSSLKQINVALIDQDGQVVEDEAEGFLRCFFQRPVKVTIVESFDGLTGWEYAYFMVRSRDAAGRVLYAIVAGAPTRLGDPGEIETRRLNPNPVRCPARYR
jgi:hypothetical protein